ncbi:hypothetical protein LAZ67_9003841 [Cordylochernes scorpioides]|uniref:Transposase n=1 Tax=Cordylochernes scorpioides TaxID=51811 RepID=A0ABY6KVB9_9ARAC|nr:hypothetical protein LAZ67_9003841 [Cordylochernes scorpioides]
MEAPLKDCTTLEQRAVIRFLNAEGIQTSQICQRMKNIYVQKWTNYMFLRSQRSAGKVLLTIFWDVDGPICLDFLSSRQRMNSNLYCDILVNKLKPGIRNKRRGKLSKGVLLLHDNARPHTSCKTVSTIIKLDLAPSDYFLFGLLKKELKGKRFDSDEDVQKVVQDFFHTLPKSAYKEGIYKLPERWRRCIESQGRERKYNLPQVKDNPNEQASATVPFSLFTDQLPRTPHTCGPPRGPGMIDRCPIWMELLDNINNIRQQVFININSPENPCSEFLTHLKIANFQLVKSLNFVWVHTIETLSEASSDITIILGEFNAKSSFWGSPVLDNKSQQVEDMLTDLDLTPLNNGENTYLSPQAQNPQ